MANSLPPNLLNRVNKELKGKEDALRQELNRKQSITRLEKEVLEATKSQLQDANNQLTSIKRVEQQTRSKVENSQSEATKVKSEVEKLKQAVLEAKGRSKDGLLKLTQVEQRVEATRKKVKEKQDEYNNNEGVLMKWLEENQLTKAATQAADGIYTDKQVKFSQLRGQSQILMAKVQQLESEFESEQGQFKKVSEDLRDCQEQTLQLKKEKQNVLQRLKEVEEREKEIQSHKQGHEESDAERKQILFAKIKEKDTILEAYQKMEKLNEQTQKQQLENTDEKNQQKIFLEKCQAAVDEIENDCRITEINFQNAFRQQKQITSEISFLKKKLEDGKTKSLQNEQKYQRLLQQHTKMRSNMDSLTKETETIAAIIQINEEEAQIQTQSADRGQLLMQQQIALQVEAAHQTEKLSQEVMVRQNQLKKLNEKTNLFKKRVQELDSIIENIDDSCLKQKALIQEYEGVIGDQVAEVRREKTQEIKRLRQELEEVEMERRRSQRAVENAEAQIRFATQDAEAIHDFVAGTETEMQEVSLEIEQLQRELDACRLEKQKEAEVAEDLYWRKEALEMKVQQKSEKIAESKQQRELIQQEIHEKQMEVESEVNAKMTELKIVEEERKRLNSRLLVAKTAVSRLQSRYEDHIKAMQIQLKPDDLRSDEVDTEISPEELHTKAILLRTAEREELQEKGDHLDKDIVKADKELHQLDQALLLLKKTPTDPLLLAHYTDAERLEDEEEERFLEDIRGQFTISSTQMLENERIQWTEETMQLTEKLHLVQDKMRTKFMELQIAKASKSEVLAELRALNRQYERQCRDGAEAEMELDKLQNVIRLKQGGFYANPNSGRVVNMAKARDKIDQVAYDLQSKVVKMAAQQEGQEKIYFSFRELVDRYDVHGVLQAGIATRLASGPPDQTAPTATTTLTVRNTGGSPSSSSVCSSSASSTLSSVTNQVRPTSNPTAAKNNTKGLKGRPASKALIEAINGLPLQTTGKQLRPDSWRKPTR